MVHVLDTAQDLVQRFGPSVIFQRDGATYIAAEKAAGVVNHGVLPESLKCSRGFLWLNTPEATNLVSWGKPKDPVVPSMVLTEYGRVTLSDILNIGKLQAEHEDSMVRIVDHDYRYNSRESRFMDVRQDAKLKSAHLMEKSAFLDAVRAREDVLLEELAAYKVNYDGIYPDQDYSCQPMPGAIVSTEHVLISLPRSLYYPCYASIFSGPAGMSFKTISMYSPRPHHVYVKIYNYHHNSVDPIYDHPLYEEGQDPFLLTEDTSTWPSKLETQLASVKATDKSALLAKLPKIEEDLHVIHSAMPGIVDVLAKVNDLHEVKFREYRERFKEAS
jgi:hypothetical protein